MLNHVARIGRGRLVQCLLVLGFVNAGCRDLDVVTESYATLQEATQAGAVDRGWVPRGLPAGTREIREAHDLDSNRQWGLFNFPQNEGETLRMLLGPELSLAGLRCTAPRRIEWWPVLLREELDHEQIMSTGARAYSAREGDLIFVVNWNQGRAYYWTRE
jgi:hypothetical protein